MFDFIIYRGDKLLSNGQKQEEYKKLIKYFLASLAIPDEDQWVNLSPYEKTRIIKDDFGKTLMGRDLLAQDYILKQITASLIYPEEGLGKQFWEKVYAKAQQRYGTTNIPVNTFNKVWIIPDDALIYEKANTAYVLKNHLKVMLEEDYLSLSHHVIPAQAGIHNINALGSQMIRELILPALEKEVNEGKNFAMLRQVYSGMLLAAWFKRTLKKSILGQIYADKAKLKGVDQDPKNNEAIYQRYLQAYKKGVFNYIKEDADNFTKETIPRKYFSGGTFGYAQDEAMAVLGKPSIRETEVLTPADAATTAKDVSDEDLAQVSMDKAMSPRIGQGHNIPWTRFFHSLLVPYGTMVKKEERTKSYDEVKNGRQVVGVTIFLINTRTYGYVVRVQKRIDDGRGVFSTSANFAIGQHENIIGQIIFNHFLGESEDLFSKTDFNNEEMLNETQDITITQSGFSYVYPQFHSFKIGDLRARLGDIVDGMFVNNKTVQVYYRTGTTIRFYDVTRNKADILNWINYNLDKLRSPDAEFFVVKSGNELRIERKDKDAAMGVIDKVKVDSIKEELKAAEGNEKTIERILSDFEEYLKQESINISENSIEIDDILDQFNEILNQKDFIVHRHLMPTADQDRVLVLFEIEKKSEEKYENPQGASFTFLNLIQKFGKEYPAVTNNIHTRPFSFIFIQNVKTIAGRLIALKGPKTNLMLVRSDVVDDENWSFINQFAVIQSNIISKGFFDRSRGQVEGIIRNDTLLMAKEMHQRSFGRNYAIPSRDDNILDEKAARIFSIYNSTDPLYTLQVLIELAISADDGLIKGTYNLPWSALAGLARADMTKTNADITNQILKWLNDLLKQAKGTKTQVRLQLNRAVRQSAGRYYFEIRGHTPDDNFKRIVSAPDISRTLKALAEEIIPVQPAQVMPNEFNAVSLIYTPRGWRLRNDPGAIMPGEMGMKLEYTPSGWRLRGPESVESALPVAPPREIITLTERVDPLERVKNALNVIVQDFNSDVETRKGGINTLIAQAKARGN